MFNELRPRGHLDLGEADLKNTKLVKVDFSSTNLIKADLTEANFTDAKLDYANLIKANFSKAIFKGMASLRSDLRLLTRQNLSKQTSQEHIFLMPQ